MPSIFKLYKQGVVGSYLNFVSHSQLTSDCLACLVIQRLVWASNGPCESNKTLVVAFDVSLKIFNNDIVVSHTVVCL